MPSAAVARYYAYKATKAVELYRPIMYLYFASAGLSFFQITVLEAAYNATTVLGEVPTGYLGDRLGRRNGLILGTVLITLTLLGLGVAGGLSDPFPAFLVLYICWSLGYTFRSGTEDAWLYDSLVGKGRSFSDLRGRGESFALASGVVAAVAGGYLAAIELAYPFYAAAAVTGLGAAILLTVEDDGGDDPADRTTLSASLDAVRAAFADPRLRAFLVLYYVLFSAATYLAFIFLQPRIETVAAGYQLGDVETLLGWYYAGISLAAAAFTYRAEWIRETVGLRLWFVAVPVGVGLLLVGQWVLPVSAFVAFVLVRGLSEATRVFASQYVNDRIDDVGRATTLSAMSMVSGLAVIPFQLGSGLLSDAVSPGAALAAAGGVLVVGAVLAHVVASPVDAEVTG
ncbi:MFS transporter [Halolamina salifodinae]|uniref:MFS family permease n=1 Tax=Halolamina salifodinae TaxID=1202767 RepID=A0A8T4GVR7_9EURY|nr:MFS transporter [Halolamina salifodinae]MBP1986530.1 MFS family permease [Halolamina salifodinae]